MIVERVERSPDRRRDPAGFEHRDFIAAVERCVCKRGVKDKDNLVRRPALVGEDVLQYAQQPQVGDALIDLLADLADNRRCRPLASLDLPAQRPREARLLDRIEAFRHENPIAVTKDADGDDADHGLETLEQWPFDVCGFINCVVGAVRDPAARSIFFGGHNDDTRVLGQLHRRIEGTHQSVLHDTGHGHGTAQPTQMILHRRRRSVGWQVKRRNPRLGGDLLVPRPTRRAALIFPGRCHRVLLSIRGDHKNRHFAQIAEYIGLVGFLPIIARKLVYHSTRHRFRFDFDFHMSKRVFIFGAGFSKPAGIPLATELLPLLNAKLELDEMREWLDGLQERLTWLDGHDQQPMSFVLNIEQVFHYAHFDIEVFRLQQHLSPVGRGDGETPWNQAESVKAWLSYLEDALRDVIFEADDKSDLAPISRWAKVVNEQDAVLTFNYDTLVERALASESKAWNHGTGRDEDEGIPVYKLHGSIDWIVAHRSESLSILDLLFDKENANRSKENTGSVEDDYRLWRCRTREQLAKWIDGRILQRVGLGASPRTVGIAGLGAYKELWQFPGLGYVWSRGMRALYQADLAVVVGFSMSDFDAMAQMQFAEVARARKRENRPLRVRVIDSGLNGAIEDRFRRVFRSVDCEKKAHEAYDWSELG